MDFLVEQIKAFGFGQAQRLLFSSVSKPTFDYVLKQGVRLLKSVDDKPIHAELKALQRLLDGKVKIISPSIDLIEFKSGRGNVFLESALPLARGLHRDIIRLGKRLDNAATSEDNLRLAGQRQPDNRALSDHRAELLLIIEDIKGLIARIDRDVPSMLLAITNSGEKMNSALSPGMSPSRMMQASWFLNFADFQFAANNLPVQIGPSFTLSLYMLFRSHAVPQKSGGSLATPDHFGEATPVEEPYGLGECDRKPTWQEVMHKARVRLYRTPMDWVFDPTQGYCPQASPDPGTPNGYSTTSALAVLGSPGQYSYHLEIVEDLDDSRAHDEESAKATPFNDIPLAGIRESIPIYQLAKIFYTDTGRLLNIKDTGDGDNSPVLLLKRDATAKTPNRLREEWLNESDSSESGVEDEQASLDEQDCINRQLREESAAYEEPTEKQEGRNASYLPRHVDPEWLAFEVHMEDEPDDAEDTEDEDELSEDSSDDSPRKLVEGPKPRSERHRSSVDSNLEDNIRRTSLQSSPPQPYSGDIGQAGAQHQMPNTAGSPFGPVLTSLSLLEMLIRLTSLQEFQQTPHLSIPDHILTFFLEETSTTGLQQGEAQWALRNEAKRRVGFDPYADTPTRR